VAYSWTATLLREKMRCRLKPSAREKIAPQHCPTLWGARVLRSRRNERKRHTLCAKLVSWHAVANRKHRSRSCRLSPDRVATRCTTSTRKFGRRRNENPGAKPRSACSAVAEKALSFANW
jgi:hypothetical protein